jgi:PadR family transcriptional regulator
VAVYLGEFEQLILLAVLRLDAQATGAAIRATVQRGSRRTVWIGAVYTTLDRLERKGLVRSHVTRVPGGQRRKVYALSAGGRAAVAQAYATWTRMTRGLKPKLEAQ